MKTIELEFAGLARQLAKLKKMEQNEKYWAERENFVENLKAYLKEEFTELPKSKFLTLCDMVSTYRPVQPFSFLVSISLRSKTKALVN